MPTKSYIPYMRKAIELAQRSRLETYPNPAVGALLVQDGKIVACGWHKGAGLPHAEIECLNDARAKGVSTKGATLVVTLEPCNHYGKTPPCTEAILAAEIGVLVFGAHDPNHEAAGGAKRLTEAGVEVIGPVLEQECLDLIADFLIWQTTDRPYVILKLAATIDGRIASRTGHSKWISCPAAREQVHQLRARIGASGGAILVGGGTFRSDNPSLTARPGNRISDRQPLACILSSRLPKVDADFTLLHERPAQTVFFASPASTASTTAEALRKIGCRVFPLGPSQKGGGPDFQTMFREIRENLGCPYVLCEGGGKLALSLLEANMIDEFHLFLAPLVLGDNEARPLFGGRNPLNMDEALKLRFCMAKMLDCDAHLILRPLPVSSTSA